MCKVPLHNLEIYQLKSKSFPNELREVLAKLTLYRYIGFKRPGYADAFVFTVIINA